MEKRTRVVIRRSNHHAEMYDNDSRPIGFGYQGKSFSLMEGSEVCLDKDAIYCFTDAVIEHTEVIKDRNTGISTTKVTKIPRFIIDYKGFYVCSNKCNNGIKECVGIPISNDEFWDDSKDMEERLGMKAGILTDNKQGRPRKNEKVEDIKEIAQNEIDEDVLL